MHWAGHPHRAEIFIVGQPAGLRLDIFSLGGPARLVPGFAWSLLSGTMGPGVLKIGSAQIPPCPT